VADSFEFPSLKLNLRGFHNEAAHCPTSVRELLPTCSISAHQFGREAPGFIGTCSFWLVCVAD
jgi:hypothetical protein